MSLLNPAFKYVPASKTDIRKTFARIRAQQKREAEAQVKPTRGVTPLRKGAAK